MSTLEKIKTEQERLTKRLSELGDQYAFVTMEIEETRVALNEIEAALGVFNRYADDEPQADDEAETESQNRVQQITAKDAIWKVLSESGGAGLRSNIIKKKAENLFGITISSKTCGNILWRFKEQGDATREGHLWYPVEAPAEGQPALRGMLRPSGAAFGRGTRVLIGLDDEPPEKDEGPNA